MKIKSGKQKIIQEKKLIARSHSHSRSQNIHLGGCFVSLLVSPWITLRWKCVIIISYPSHETILARNLKENDCEIKEMLVSHLPGSFSQSLRLVAHTYKTHNMIGSSLKILVDNFVKRFFFIVNDKTLTTRRAKVMVTRNWTYPQYKKIS